jgi:hydroxypyruvate isomerase
MPRFAANLSMLFTEVPFLDRFAGAAKAGFKGVEFLFPYAIPAEELTGRLHEEGLRQALFNFPPGDWDAGDRGLAALPGRQSEFLDSIGLAIEYAKALDCPTIHAMAGIPPDDISRDEAMEVYVGNLRHAAEAFAPEGITVVIEPLKSRAVPGYFLNNSGEASRIIEKVSRKNIGLQLDFFHCQIMEGDLETRFRNLAGIVRHIQIAGVPSRHEPDTGEVNYPHLFNVMDEIGYDGWVGCEYNPGGKTINGLGWFQAAKS